MENENAKAHRATSIEAIKNINTNQEEKENEGEQEKNGDIKTEFIVKIVKETNNGIKLEWNLISETDVYCIQVHHKVKGWQNVEW